MPEMDELPVAKIVNFKGSDDINNNVYAQGRLCYVKNIGLVVRLWIFEASPANARSQMTFCLNGDKGNLVLAFSHDGVVQCSVSGKVVAPPTVNYFEAEDLQGEYWGGQFVFDDEFLQDNLYSDLNFSIGNVLYGNIITFVNTKGSLFEEEIGKFVLVS